MKKLVQFEWVKAVCGICLAFAALIATQSACIFIYGEPHYPAE